MKKLSTYILLTFFALSCSKKKTEEAPSSELAQRIQGIQVGREGLDNNFNATVSFLNPDDESSETITFKSNFRPDNSNYVIDAEEGKPFRLHIQCKDADPECNNSIIKVQGLSSSSLPGTATIEQFCIEDPSFKASLLAGEYNSDIYEELMKELALDIKEAEQAGEELSQRLLIRRIQSSNKHQFNYSLYKVEDPNSVKVFQIRGDVDSKKITVYRYYYTNGSRSRRVSHQKTLASKSRISRKSIEGEFNYNLLVKLIDSPTGLISPVLELNPIGLTGGFQADDTNPNRLAPSVFDF